MRFKCLLTLLLLSSVCHAQDIPLARGGVQAPALPDGETWVVTSQGRISEKIYIILDVSISMASEANLALACDKILAMVMSRDMSPTDEVKIQIVTFTDVHSVFRHSDGEAWFDLPDEKGRITELHKFIEDIQSEQCNSTDPTSALKYALEDADEDSTILLVTDGEFHAMPATKMVVACAQEHSKVARGYQVPIFCYGIDMYPQDSLSWLAENNGGWYIHKATRRFFMFRGR